ncbi:MAG: hypothetical protein IT176_07665 [Acidobacteria bacterium]|nr:hypothetical protein [Acidobacteriota bacterium]
MLRLALLLVLFVVFARAFWRLVDGVLAGLGGGRDTPPRPVPMVRDPVCGTFVVPGRAVTLAGDRQPVFFCSTACRDKYRARTA